MQTSLRLIKLSVLVARACRSDSLYGFHMVSHSASHGFVSAVFSIPSGPLTCHKSDNPSDMGCFQRCQGRTRLCDTKFNARTTMTVTQTSTFSPLDASWTSRQHSPCISSPSVQDAVRSARIFTRYPSPWVTQPRCQFHSMEGRTR